MLFILNLIKCTEITFSCPAFNMYICLPVSVTRLCEESRNFAFKSIPVVSIIYFQKIKRRFKCKFQFPIQDKWYPNNISFRNCDIYKSRNFTFNITINLTISNEDGNAQISGKPILSSRSFIFEAQFTTITIKLISFLSIEVTTHKTQLLLLVEWSFYQY